MSRINRKMTGPRTYEGGPADHITAEQELRRSVLSCLLWEPTFYESGVDTAGRIFQLVQQVDTDKVCNLAEEARHEMRLRHVPLLLVVALARKHKGQESSMIRDLVPRVIRRPDEMCELLAIYWAINGQEAPLPNAVKRGLADVFPSFSAYQLAKYNRKRQVTLTDVMFLCHPKPEGPEQAAIWQKLIDDELEPPDTWEVALSKGEDKKETFERLLREEKLGDMATIMNLRNMVEAGVDLNLIRERLEGGLPWVLPYRFLTAARMVPDLEPELDRAMLAALEEEEPLEGRTVILVDVSGSMSSLLSANGVTTARDAACGLAVHLAEVCEEVRVRTFSTRCVTVPPRRGIALRDAILDSQPHRATYLGEALKGLKEADRLVVVTDEQSHDRVPTELPFDKLYLINVRPYGRGVSYGDLWVHIDGFSEQTVRFIRGYEKLQTEGSDSAS